MDLKWQLEKGRIAAIASAVLGKPSRLPELATVALAHPAFAQEIAGRLIRIEKAKYQTAECRNIALGHALVVLAQLAPVLGEKNPAQALAQRQLRNPRPATRKKAQACLRKLR